jgi:hypothetical protein
MTILFIYLLEFTLCVALGSYFFARVIDDDEIFNLVGAIVIGSFFWPVTLPLVLLGALGYFCATKGMKK